MGHPCTQAGWGVCVCALSAITGGVVCCAWNPVSWLLCLVCDVFHKHPARLLLSPRATLLHPSLPFAPLRCASLAFDSSSCTHSRCVRCPSVVAMKDTIAFCHNAFPTCAVPQWEAFAAMCAGVCHESLSLLQLKGDWAVLPRVCCYRQCCNHRTHHRSQQCSGLLIHCVKCTRPNVVVCLFLRQLRAEKNKKQQQERAIA